MKKRKIIFFLQSGVGGAERVTVTIAKMLDRSKFEVIFALLTRRNGNQTIKNFIPKTDRVISIDNSGGIRLLLKLYECIAEEKPSIVFSSMMYINTKVLSISWLFPKIHFVVRNNNYLYTLSIWQKTILKYSYKLADKIIAQTDEMRNELLDIGINEECVITLHNPIDIETIESKIKAPNPFGNNKCVKYVASGRFNYVKGFDVLIDSFSYVVQNEPQSELYIVGKIDGPCQGYYNDVKKRINDLNLADRVHCVGFQTNPYIYVKYADCFVLSSRNEGLPNVLIEALYLGTPAAATKCIPIISRIVKDGVTGCLAEVDNPHSLANAMLKASKYGRIISTYKPADERTITNIFDYD